MTGRTVREQVEAHYRAERLGIMLEAPDVTEAEAGWILECEQDAELARAMGEPVECSCGAHR